MPLSVRFRLGLWLTFYQSHLSESTLVSNEIRSQGSENTQPSHIVSSQTCLLRASTLNTKDIDRSQTIYSE
jgi:hypothetical protein